MARSALGALLLLLALELPLAVRLGSGGGWGEWKEEPSPPPKRKLVNAPETSWESWRPLAQVPGMPKLVPGRSYVFITHHKTGTNLMQRLCNLTARATTAKWDMCAYCFRVLPPIAPGGPPACEKDPYDVHGPVRGTFSRFTLVSNIKRHEYALLQRFAPDFRAVHMVRDPVKMAQSAYAYNTYLESPAGEKFRWDKSANLAKAHNMSSKLKVEARAILSKVKEMAGTDELARFDNRSLTLDLEAFSRAYDDTATKLFNHLFDTPPADEIALLGLLARNHDTSRWTSQEKRKHAPVIPKMLINMGEVERGWSQLLEEGDQEVAAVTRYREQLGYGEGSQGWRHGL